MKITWTISAPRFGGMTCRRIAEETAAKYLNLAEEDRPSEIIVETSGGLGAAIYEHLKSLNLPATEANPAGELALRISIDGTTQTLESVETVLESLENPLVQRKIARIVLKEQRNRAL